MGHRRPAINTCSIKEPICSPCVCCLLVVFCSSFRHLSIFLQQKEWLTVSFTVQPLFSLCILLLVPFIAHYNHNIFCSGQNGQFQFFESFSCSLSFSCFKKSPCNLSSASLRAFMAFSLLS